MKESMVSAEQAKVCSDLRQPKIQRKEDRKRKRNIAKYKREITRNIKKAIKKGYYSVIIYILETKECIEICEWLHSIGYECHKQRYVIGYDIKISWKDK